MNPIDPTPYLGSLEERYGLSRALFDHLLFFDAGGKIIRACAPPMDLPEEVEFDRMGLDFLRIDMAVPRPTTAGAMTWAAHATRHVVDLEDEQCDAYLRRQPFTLTADQQAGCTSRGHLLIRYDGQGLGMGFLISTRQDDPNQWKVKSLFPKAFTTALANTSALGNPR